MRDTEFSGATGPYPIALNLAGRKVLVVGGGQVAGRKIKGLLEADALVTVISLQVTAELRELSSRGVLTLEERAYRAGDITGKGYLLVFAATGSRAVNREVALEAAAAGCLSNVADDPAAGDFSVPAVLRQGAITIAISTLIQEEGETIALPALAVYVKRLLGDVIGPDYTRLAQALVKLKPEIRAGVAPARRAEVWRKLLESGYPQLLAAAKENEAGELAQKLILEAGRD